VIDHRVRPFFKLEDMPMTKDAALIAAQADQAFDLSVGESDLLARPSLADQHNAQRGLTMSTEAVRGDLPLLLLTGWAAEIERVVVDRMFQLARRDNAVAMPTVPRMR
jgi:hypothetical protein